ncbi:MAG: response regulator transcription factor [Opitutaceae bacterium]|nr:response regulator transcription factor [Opitutaceae bacterium]
MRPIRVLIAEDQDLVRSGLTSLLASTPGIEVVASVRTGLEVMAGVEERRPDVVVCDYFLGGGLEGADLFATLSQLPAPRPRVLALSMHGETSVGERAIRAGARGFMTKEDSAGELAHAIQKVASGGIHVSGELLGRISDIFSGSRPPFTHALSVLSDRELQVYRLLGANLDLWEIGQRLGISTRTVGTHREAIKRKLFLQTGEQLVAHARAWLRANAT